MAIANIYTNWRLAVSVVTSKLHDLANIGTAVTTVSAPPPRLMQLYPPFEYPAKVIWVANRRSRPRRQMDGRAGRDRMKLALPLTPARGPVFCMPCSQNDEGYINDISIWSILVILIILVYWSILVIIMYYVLVIISIRHSIVNILYSVYEVKSVFSPLSTFCRASARRLLVISILCITLNIIAWIDGTNDYLVDMWT